MFCASSSGSSWLASVDILYFSSFVVWIWREGAIFYFWTIFNVCLFENAPCIAQRLIQIQSSETLIQLQCYWEMIICAASVSFISDDRSYLVTSPSYFLVCYVIVLKFKIRIKTKRKWWWDGVMMWKRHTHKFFSLIFFVNNIRKHPNNGALFSFVLSVRVRNRVVNHYFCRFM